MQISPVNQAPHPNSSGSAPDEDHSPTRVRYDLLSCPIDGLTPDEALDRIFGWAEEHDSRAVYFCNAHSVVTGSLSPDFAHLVARADLAAPDGMPVAWMLRRHGFPGQQRISGPDLMLAYCERAAKNGHSIFLLGSDPDTLAKLHRRLERQYEGLRIAGAISPPFRQLSAEEDQRIVDVINATDARVLFVGLGCPKQEWWIDSHRGIVQAVMIGVGAAFQFHAGVVARAPPWMQKAGLEWLFRLACEPRKLWKRYLITNVLFISGIVRAKFRRMAR
jgi:N-acetylglucosaminyldiphosphoundecaprenol N-acetyl-beta-D-mannosaminyltransferase